MCVKMSVMSVKIKYTDKLENGICSLSGIFVLLIVLNSCQIAFLWTASLFMLLPILFCTFHTCFCACNLIMHNAAMSMCWSHLFNLLVRVIGCVFHANVLFIMHVFILFFCISLFAAAAIPFSTQASLKFNLRVSYTKLSSAVEGKY